MDLPGVIATVRTIQTYSKYVAFDQIRLNALDINDNAFGVLVATFKPTHASCIIGLQQEESSFLATVASVESVKFISITQRCDGSSDPFIAYGFEQIARIRVRINGSLQIKYVLVAKRKINTAV